MSRVDELGKPGFYSGHRPWRLCLSLLCHPAPVQSLGTWPGSEGPRGPREVLTDTRPQAIWGFLVLRRARDLFSSGAPRTSPLWAGAMPLSGRHCLCEKSWVPLPAGTLPMIHTEQPADTASMKPSQIPSRGDTFF